MKKKMILYNVMYLMYTILNVIMYLTNAMSYIQLNRYKDSSIPNKNAFMLFIFIIFEVLALVMLSSSTTKYATPFQKLYYRKLRIAYFPYLILIVLRVVTVNIHQKSAWYVYMTIWTLLAIVSTIIYLNTFRSCKALIQNDTEKCNKMLHEYSLELSEDELIIMRKIKRSIIHLFSLFVVSTIFANTFYSNKIMFVGFTIAYMVVIYLSMMDIFRFYYPKSCCILNAMNALISGAGCVFVWFVYQKIIDISFLSNRTLEELVVFQLIFMLPCLIWLASKYKRYQRHNINQIADNFMKGNKSE